MNVITSIDVGNDAALEKENTLNRNQLQTQDPISSEGFSEYVAHLQLHMALQARNLVPSFKQTKNSREQLLQQTQANFEKLVSRQGI
ncbi:MAG: hypothetical protein AB4352_15640 [Hormoscilla sp.]